MAATARDKLLGPLLREKAVPNIGPDIESQLANLFAAMVSARRARHTQLLHYPRYLKAIALRLDKGQGRRHGRDLRSHKQIRTLAMPATARPSEPAGALPLDRGELRAIVARALRTSVRA